MINSNYSVEQCQQMLGMINKSMTRLISQNEWPKDIKDRYGDKPEFFFTNTGIIKARTVRGDVLSWSGPVPIDDFWMRRISQSLSYQCSIFLYSLQRRTKIKDLTHLICKFHNLKYIPSPLKI